MKSTKDNLINQWKRNENWVWLEAKHITNHSVIKEKIYLFFMKEASKPINLIPFHWLKEKTTNQLCAGGYFKSNLASLFWWNDNEIKRMKTSATPSIKPIFSFQSTLWEWVEWMKSGWLRRMAHGWEWSCFLFSSSLVG